MFYEDGPRFLGYSRPGPPGGFSRDFQVLTEPQMAAPAEVVCRQLNALFAGRWVCTNISAQAYQEDMDEISAFLRVSQTWLVPLPD